jgi:hypothetical protein
VLSDIGQLAERYVQSIRNSSHVSPSGIDPAGLDMGDPGRVHARSFAKLNLAHMCLKTEGSNGFSEADLRVVATRHWLWRNIEYDWSSEVHKADRRLPRVGAENSSLPIKRQPRYRLTLALGCQEAQTNGTGKRGDGTSRPACFFDSISAVLVGRYSRNGLLNDCDLHALTPSPFVCGQGQ